MTVFTIDVSHWDRDRRGAPLDWDTIASQGIAAACVRATYGDPDTYFPQTRYFREMASGAAAEGFLTGGYHNLIHGDDASINRQVDVLGAELDAVGATFGMLDVEPYTALQTNGLWPRWADVVRFRDRWTLVGGDRPLLFYIPRWVWSDWLQLADLSILGEPVVAAAYPAGDAQDTHSALYERVGGNNGAGWRTYGGVLPALWQFTSTARVDGASERTDVCAYRGGLEQLAALLGGGPMALPANWRVVESIKTFERQCRPLAPNAPATSFGTVADSSHTTTSDHYPHQVAALGSQPVVTAGDIPLAEQLDPRAVLDAVRRSRDNRVKYGISRGEMFSSYATSSYPAWTWRPYSGSDGHFDHGHLSVLDAAIADDPRPWEIGTDVDILEQGPNSRQMAYRVDAITYGLDKVRGSGLAVPDEEMWIVKHLKETKAAVDQLSLAVSALAAAIGSGPAGTLTKDDVRQVVADDIAARLRAAADADT